MVEAEEVKTFPAHLQVHDPGLGRLRLQPELGQEQPKPRKRVLGLRSGLAHHHQVSGRGDSHPPALAEPDVNLSTHPAPIAQPSGRAPNRQCANSRGDRLAISASHAIARRSLLRSRLWYFRVAQRTRWLLSLRRK